MCRNKTLQRAKPDCVFSWPSRYCDVAWRHPLHAALARVLATSLRSKLCHWLWFGIRASHAGCGCRGWFCWLVVLACWHTLRKTARLRVAWRHPCAHEFATQTLQLVVAGAAGSGGCTPRSLACWPRVCVANSATGCGLASMPHMLVLQAGCGWRGWFWGLPRSLVRSRARVLAYDAENCAATHSVACSKAPPACATYTAHFFIEPPTIESLMSKLSSNAIMSAS
ncbi:MAG: hypothetical protein Ta2A_16350 [Treponemataceae bacterium]|nr:MAG: hypothetical protein Ta2A_16350 [Treponemataceae bacterium]